jgi:hypothetical protein
MCILSLYSNEERRVLFYIHIYYLFVIKVCVLFIFYDNKKNKSWYMCLIYNQSGFDSYANQLARSYSIKVRSFWQFQNRSARSTAPRIEWKQNQNIGVLSMCLDKVLDDDNNGDDSLHDFDMTTFFVVLC